MPKTTSAITISTTLLPKNIFGVSVNDTLVAQAVRVYLSNRRQATAATLGRGEVNRTKRKMYRQKGTGRARHGARSAPLFVGGGVAHGPRGTANHHLKLTSALRRQALTSALTAKAKSDQILVVTELDKFPARTNLLSQALGSLLKTRKLSLPLSRLTFVTSSPLSNLTRAARNLSVKVITAKSLNTYTAFTSRLLIFTPSSLKALASRL